MLQLTVSRVYWRTRTYFMRIPQPTVPELQLAYMLFTWLCVGVTAFALDAATVPLGWRAVKLWLVPLTYIAYE